MKTLHKQKIIILFFIFAAIVLLSACAHKELVEPCLEGVTYGFWRDLLHGFIAPFGLIASLFRDNITMFAQNNNGAWYSFGFLLGSGGWGFLGGRGSRRH